MYGLFIAFLAGFYPSLRNIQFRLAILINDVTKFRGFQPRCDLVAFFVSQV